MPYDKADNMAISSRSTRQPSVRVLLISYAFKPAIGGIETSSEILADAFTAAGHEVRVITKTPCESADSSPYPIIRDPSPGTLLNNHVWADIILENNPSVRLGYPKLFLNKKSIIILNTWLSSSDAPDTFSTRLKTYYLGKTSKVIAVSKAVRERCWPSASIIANSYNDNLFRLLPRKRTNNFVFVGRLVSDKGAELALEAFRQLVFSQSIPELETASLTIIGDGDERKKLEQRISQLPDPGRVRLTGALTGEALVNELNQHSFQFIPSMWEEPFGIVALEGISCGLIPIASDGGGLPDAVGNAGVVFKRGQLDSLMAVTTRLVQSRQLQEQCRQAAPEHLRRHSSQAITRQYLDLIERL